MYMLILLLIPFLFPQYIVNCNTVGQMPDITFNIHGQQFTLPASAYVSQVGFFA